MTDLHAIRQRKAELEEQLSRPAPDQDIAALGKEHARVIRIVEKADRLDALTAAREHLQKNVAQETGEMATLARDELAKVETEIAELAASLDDDLQPRDPNDTRDAIVEIRAGTGGDEATLFAQNLFRMYQRFAERRGWTTTLLSVSRSELRGIKDLACEVAGEGAYGWLKYEGGVHRVQRIPETEKSGRIHTSTATVAVLPKIEAAELIIDPKDLRIDTSTSGGHGGQSVNTTYSAIRILHLPTGIIVTCQDERSQRQNRERAMEVLRARLAARQAEERRQHEDSARRNQVGTAERAEKIRTYNFPQDRLTDHRLQTSVHGLADILDGKLDPLLTKLRKASRV